MSFSNRKKYAKGILTLYVFITITFPLAHNDYVPLNATLSLSSADFHSGSVDSNLNDLVCPAHNFAQSTTGTAAPVHNFKTPQRFFYFKLHDLSRVDATPVNALTTRAPPEA